MITDTTFATEWAILEDRFQTRHNPETAARYFEALDEELTDEQLKLACRRAFRFETFFPAPQCLIDHALGDFMTQAEAAWDDVFARLGGSNEAILTDEGSLSRKILNAVGGSKMLREASDFGRRDMREQFTRRYARALRGETTPQVRAAQVLAAPALQPDPEIPRPLEGPRGKAFDFLKMAQQAGIPVTVPSEQAAD